MSRDDLLHSAIHAPHAGPVATPRTNLMLPKRPGKRPADLSQPIKEVKARIYPEIAGLRLDQALAELFTWRSRSSIQKLIKEGKVRIRLGGEAPGSRKGELVSQPRSARKVFAEDLVMVEVPPRALVDQVDLDLLPSDLRILWEDPYLVALDKPAGLAVHPTSSRLSGTLINLLHGLYRNADDPARDVVPRLCHRLDRETSGLILVAKDAQAHSEVRKQFEAQTVQKSYLALVEGCPEQEETWIDAAIGPARRSAVRLKMGLREDGLQSLTHVLLRQRGRKISLVECFPRTGRQHQIRVHLASRGLPLVGDKLYGPDEQLFLRGIDDTLTSEDEALLRLPRQALHSHTLSLRHPISGDPLELSCPFPEDMRKLLEEA